MGAFALLIGISEFTDPRLAKLNAPSGDVEVLAQVLRDPAEGNFDNVATCIDQDFQTIRKQITKLLLDDRSPSDLVLLYYSGLRRGQDNPGAALRQEGMGAHSGRDGLSSRASGL